MKLSLARVTAATAAAVLTCFVLYAAVYKRAVASIGLRRAASTVRQDMPDFVRTVATREALAILAANATGSREDQYTAMMKGSNQLFLGRSEEAEASFKEALRWGRRPEIYVALASAQASNGRRDEAIESLAAAARFDAYSLVGSGHADLTAEVLRRFTGRSSRAHIAEMYLSMAIAYFEDGFFKEGVAMAGQAALYDERILRRRELVAWGMADHTADRYLELKENKSEPSP